MESRDLRTLAALVENETLALVTTDIVVREVHANIAADMKRARAVHERFRSQPEVRILWAVEDTRPLLTRFDEDDVEEEVHKSFDEFLKRTETIIISTDGIDVGPVLEAYFKKEPPFGEGEKRKEFPDAISIAALRKWRKSEKADDVAIVTGDEGFADGAEDIDGTEHFEKLKELLDEVYDDARADFVKRQLLKRKKELVGLIKDSFTDRGFYVEDHYEGEVSDVTVTEVHLGDDPDDYDIVELDDEKATITTSVDIDFMAELTYGDENMMSYDNEDKTMTFWANTEESVSRTKDAELQIEVLLEGLDPDAVEIEDVFLGFDTLFIETDRDREWRRDFK